MKIIDGKLLEDLLAEAKANPRLRKNLDLRNSGTDNSQRMLNALMPGTQPPIHKHVNSSETVILLTGNVSEVFYDDNGAEIDRVDLNPKTGRYGVQVPKGMWHTIVCHEPSVIFESKDGKYEPPTEAKILVEE